MYTNKNKTYRFDVELEHLLHVGWYLRQQHVGPIVTTRVSDNDGPHPTGCEYRLPRSGPLKITHIKSSTSTIPNETTFSYCHSQHYRSSSTIGYMQNYSDSPHPSQLDDHFSGSKPLLKLKPQTTLR